MDRIGRIRRLESRENESERERDHPDDGALPNEVTARWKLQGAFLHARPERRSGIVDAGQLGRSRDPAGRGSQFQPHVPIGGGG